jgi:hypothetical protein
MILKCECTVYLKSKNGVETAIQDVAGISARDEKQARELAVQIVKDRYKRWDAKVTAVTLHATTRVG